ncbi:MAG: archaellin/type IV pilin N-terminal domain-containing protein [Archaeoglobaceae archaeon]
MRFCRNEKGFTGLEAAIVLIAFVTVAAVFSYILLGAGFFATQKSQEVVQTGVKQATSSLELVGGVVAKGNEGSNTGKLTSVTFTLQLAAGGQPIDLSKTTITALNPKDGLRKTFVASDITDWIYSIQGTNPDNYLEEFEKAEITLDLTELDLDPNEIFIIEIKPPFGATYPIELKVPPAVDDVMVLLR